MNITECSDLTRGVLDHIRKEVSKDRPGWHLSDLLFCNIKTIYRKLGLAPAMTDDQAVMFWLGHAAQYFLVPVRPDQAKVYEVDGIQLTPDFENVYFGAVPVALGELKTTRKSLKDFDPGKDAPHYLTQLMGYAKATRVSTTHLIIFFLMGNYHPPFPTLKTWEIRFTSEEIEANWREILRRKLIIETAISFFNQPKFGHVFASPANVIRAFKGECKYCELSETCEYRV